MVVFKEKHTVLDEIVDELTQDDLICDFGFDCCQLLIDLFDTLLGEEDVEVAMAELQSFLHVHAA